MRTNTQLAAGNTSAAAKEARVAAKASKGKGKSGGGGGSSGKGTKKKASSPSESLSELALSCFEECVCVTAHCSLQSRTAASRTAKMLAVSHNRQANTVSVRYPPTLLWQSAKYSRVILGD